MTTKALTRTRQRLLSEYENLIRLIGRGRLAAKEFDLERTDDEGGRASSSHDRELLYKLHEGEVGRLRVVADAIKAMDRGEFGRCIICAKDIGQKRLAALPWAVMCVRCQENEEMNGEAPAVVRPASPELSSGMWQ